MQYVFGAVISYLLFYAVIYLHELGHAFFYHIFGCKEKMFRVSVKPSLFFSTAEPVDNEKVKTLGKWQYILICYGGVLMNFLAALLTSVLAFFVVKSDNLYLNLLVWQFLLLHLAEAVSYMLFGNVYLVSDMKGIALNEPRLRFPNLLVGLLLAAYMVFVFISLPKELFWLCLVFNIFAILCMAGGRIAFGIMSDKKCKQ